MRHRLLRLLSCLPLFVWAASLQAQVPAYDLVIRNGRVVDGTGSPWYRADLAIRGDTIVRIAPHIDAAGARVFDAADRIVAPGFIDVHTHARRNLFALPTADNYVRQGVTTLIEGPDGSSPLPLRPFFDQALATRIVPNLGAFVGQGSIRLAVIGPVNRTATPAELDRMRALTRQAMEDGALGLSTGLFYVPGTFTPTQEVIELAKIAGSMGGSYTSHMRDEAAGLLDSVRETIDIGAQGALPTQITHHKVMGKPNWGKSTQTLQLVDAARARGVDVTLDMYPYTASATNVQSALLPAWALEGDHERLLARLKDKETRAKIRAETIRLIVEERGGGDPQNVQLSNCVWNRNLAGKRLGDVTRQRGAEPTVENAADTVLWIVEQGDCAGIFHALDEADLERILRHPATMIASDGEIPIYGQASPHPRSYGTFVRVLSRYVRELKVITLEDAVRKMSSFPAQRIGLTDRGTLRVGLKADVVIFDPATVRDVATFESPHQYAEGVALVTINGMVVFENGKMTQARPGRVLYGPGRKM